MYRSFDSLQAWSIFFFQNVSYDTRRKKRMSKIPHYSAIGSLLYPMFCTRTDICFAVDMDIIYQPNLGEAHWQVVKHILKYMKSN